MGSGPSVTAKGDVATIKSRAIDKQLERDKNKAASIKKLLLLGAGECGKSTILKQVRILHDNEWEHEDKTHETRLIFSNIVCGVAQLCAGVEQLGWILSEKSENYYDIVKGVIKSNRSMDPLTAETARAIKELWADPLVQLAYENRSHLQISDSISYFLDNLDRITAPNYRPSNKDFILCRRPTTGVIECKITIKDTTFNFIDVSGQRAERKKWSHHFDNVDGVIFISAINEFDQTLNEARDMNRLDESMQLYRQVSGMIWFAKSAMVLFLNKTDLFREKIATTPLDSVFPEYSGPNTFDASIAFLDQKFRDLNLTKTPYVHYTCATDTNQVDLAISSVVDSIIQDNLAQIGIT